MAETQKPESLDDIVEALHGLAELCRRGELTALPRDFDDYADRIKKAIESEVEPMRKALKEIRDMAVAGVYDGTCDCHEMIKVAEEALKERHEQDQDSDCVCRVPA